MRWWSSDMQSYLCHNNKFKRKKNFLAYFIHFYYQSTMITITNVWGIHESPITVIEVVEETGFSGDYY